MARKPDENETPHAPADGDAPRDLPGKPTEAAAPSGAEPEETPGLSPPGQGAQVILTGDAQAAARGGTHGDVVSNTQARDAAIAAGHVAPGTTADAAAGATTGSPPAEGDESTPAAEREAQTKPAR